MLWRAKPQWRALSRLPAGSSLGAATISARSLHLHPESRLQDLVRGWRTPTTHPRHNSLHTSAKHTAANDGDHSVDGPRADEPVASTAPNPSHSSPPTIHAQQTSSDAAATIRRTHQRLQPPRRAKTTNRATNNKTLRVQDFLAEIRRAKRRPPVHAGDVFRLLARLTPGREDVYRQRRYREDGGNGALHDRRRQWLEEEVKESERGVVVEAWGWVGRGDAGVERSIRMPAACLPVLLGDPDLNVWSVAERTGCEIVLQSADGKGEIDDLSGEASSRDDVILVLSGDKYAVSYGEQELQRIEAEGLAESPKAGQAALEGAASEDSDDMVTVYTGPSTAMDAATADPSVLLSYLTTHQISTSDPLPADAPFPAPPLLDPRPFTTLLRANDLPIPQTWTRRSLASYVASLVSHRHPGPQFQSALYPGLHASSRTDVAHLLVRLFEDPRDDVRGALGTAALNAALRWFSRQRQPRRQGQRAGGGAGVVSSMAKGAPHGGGAGAGELSFRAEARRVFYHAVGARVRPDSATFNALLAGGSAFADWAGFASLLSKMAWMDVSADADTWLLFLDAVGAEGRARDGKVAWSREPNVVRSAPPPVGSAAESDGWGGQDAEEVKVEYVNAERVQRLIIDAMEAHGMLREDATRRAVAAAMAEGDADAAIGEYEAALDRWTKWKGRMEQGAVPDQHSSDDPSSTTITAQAPASPPNFDVAAFIDAQEKRYGTEWLTTECGNRLLKVLGQHGYLDTMLELMRIMASRQQSTGRPVDVASLNTVLGYVRRAALGLEIKQRQQVTFDDLDGNTPSSSDDVASSQEQAEHHACDVGSSQPVMRPTLVPSPAPPTVEALVDMAVDALGLAQAHRVRPNPVTYQLLLDLFSRLPDSPAALGAVFYEMAAAGQLTYLSRLRVGTLVWEAWARNRWRSQHDREASADGDRDVDEADERSRQTYDALFFHGQRVGEGWWPEIESQLFAKLDREAAAALAPLPNQHGNGGAGSDKDAKRRTNLGQIAQPSAKAPPPAPLLKALVDFSGPRPPRLPGSHGLLPYRARGLLARVGERAAEAYRMHAASLESERRHPSQHRHHQQRALPSPTQSSSTASRSASTPPLPGTTRAEREAAAALRWGPAWWLGIRRQPLLAAVVRDAVRADRRRRRRGSFGGGSSGRKD